MIATDAVISLATSVIKISVFGLAGVVTPQVLAFALLIGLVALPGAFLARAFVERMPVAYPQRDPRRRSDRRRRRDDLVGGATSISGIKRNVRATSLPAASTTG